ncbi:MAG: threonine--tRNA ligase, partial [Actinobacteria bacterium]
KFERKVLSKEEALKFFRKKEEDYKVELVEDIEDEEISVYQQGDFIDLCKGPHIPSAGIIKAFKLLSIAGAYWKGDEKRPMLQRIYGISFPSKKELKEYLSKLEEAKKRDHRILGKQLDLFHFDAELGPGLPLWHPKGARLRTIIEDYWKDVHLKNGYELLVIPHIARKDLWVTSGHWDFYREFMYSPMQIDDVDYIVKPMNCPGHILIYKSQTRSYRDLPLKWAEMGTVYRYERSGVLHGLMRVRGFTQDDAHIFCTEWQLEEQINSILKLAIEILKTFGFEEYEIYLSTRPEKFVGSEAHWEAATNALKKALVDMKLDYTIDPGEGVFYGPKIDIKIKDAIGRTWQCSTVQVDFNLPERFDMNFANRNNQPERPIMIHRAILGSLERFIGVLIEHYAGAFPVWLAPIQVTILPIASRHDNYAKKVAEILKESNVRVKVDERTETTAKKVRDAQFQKIPFMLIVGDNEEKAGTVAIRTRDGKDIRDVKINDFLNSLKSSDKNKALNLKL